MTPSLVPKMGPFRKYAYPSFLRKGEPNLIKSFRPNAFVVTCVFKAKETLINNAGLHRVHPSDIKK